MLVLPVAVASLVEEVLLLATPLVLVLPLSDVLELDAGEEADVLLALVDWSLLATAPVEEAVLEVEPLVLPVAAKPLVEPVWLNELLELVDGDEAVVLLLEDWSLEATEPLALVELELVDAPVLGVELEVLPPLASVLAKPLVLPVWLRELVELLDGEEEAVLLVADDWSLLAIAPVEEAVLEVAPLLLPVEAKPLVEPVWLSELLELLDGEDDATPEVLDVPVLWSLPAIELEADADGEDATDPADEFAVESVLAALEVLLVCAMELPELELPLSEAVEFWSLLVEGVVELLEVLFIEPEEFSAFAPLELALVLFELLNDELLFEVSLVLAEPLIEPAAAPEAEPDALRL